MTISRRRGWYFPNQVKVRARGPFIDLIVGNRKMSMRTPSAHRIGFEVVKMADEILRERVDDHIALTINGEDVCVTAFHARQVGSLMLRRSDDADDFQLANNLRTIET